MRNLILNLCAILLCCVGTLRVSAQDTAGALYIADETGWGLDANNLTVYAYGGTGDATHPLGEWNVKHADAVEKHNGTTWMRFDLPKGYESVVCNFIFYWDDSHRVDNKLRMPIQGTHYYALTSTNLIRTEAPAEERETYSVYLENNVNYTDSGLRDKIVQNLGVRSH